MYIDLINIYEKIKKTKKILNKQKKHIKTTVRWASFFWRWGVKTPSEYFWVKILTLLKYCWYIIYEDCMHHFKWVLHDYVIRYDILYQ